MVCLYISIINDSDNHFEVRSDNLRREDAKDSEVAMANLIENLTQDVILRAIAENGIVKEDMRMQTGPNARE